MKVVPAAELKNFIGQELEIGEWFEIDQQRINQFADVTEDRQFIHTDPEAAAQTPFGTTIAHGFLSLSMLTYLTSNSALVPENIVMGVNYGFDKVRFISPVKVNDKIRTRTTLKDVTLHGKVDSMEEATLSQGVHDGQTEEDEKTVHG
jgi:acyl dehydratase